MTGAAGKTDMLTSQRKICIGIVVEECRIPRCGVMACAAFLAQRTSMRIVIGMAIRAAFCSIMECLGLMATGTDKMFVLAQQRKGSESMIEPNVIRPRDLAVTTCAVGAQLSKMGIFTRMA